MLHTSLILSFVFLTVTLLAVWRSKNLPRTYLMTWIGLPFAYGVMCILPSYLLHAFLMLQIFSPFQLLPLLLSTCPTQPLAHVGLNVIMHLSRLIP